LVIYLKYHTYYLIFNTLSSQVAIITGAGSGIGKQLALTLLRKGYRLVLVDIDYKALDSTFTTIGALAENRMILHKLNVTNCYGWEKLLYKVMVQFGRVDYLFNVAGYLLPGYVHELSHEQIDRHIDVNVKGVLYGSRVVAEIMIKQGYGHIINVSSLAGIAAIPGLALYSASKFAVRGFSLALANELKEYGVSVSVLCPDVVRTPMMELQLSYEQAALTFSGSRILEVEEVIRAIEQLMQTKKLELVIPTSRGLLAKMANVFPALSYRLKNFLIKRGLKHIKKIRQRKMAAENQQPSDKPPKVSKIPHSS
jgi:3-oxoacyl-[acyl-carrier protein] reductase